VKNDHPTDFVKVHVDVEDFSLKLSHRAKGENQRWVKYPTIFSLPPEALDTLAKVSPTGMSIEPRNPEPDPEKTAKSPRLSRKESFENSKAAENTSDSHSDDMDDSSPEEEESSNQGCPFSPPPTATREGKFPPAGSAVNICPNVLGLVLAKLLSSSCVLFQC